MSPYLSPREAADLIRRPTADAFLVWAKRNHVPFIKARRVVLFERDVVLAAFQRSTDGQPARMPKRMSA